MITGTRPTAEDGETRKPILALEKVSMQFGGQAVLRQVQALVDAHGGRGTDAEALAREAVVFIERTDGLTLQGDAFCDLAEVLSLPGKIDEAEVALEQALERYERKRNLVMSDRVRAKLATTAARR